MRYKNYIFPHNPARIEVQETAQLAACRCPGLGVTVQHLGPGPKKVIGRGAFFGSDAMAQYRRLQSVFREKSAGLLYVPDMPAMRACFSALSCIGEGAGDVIEYTFEFLEDSVK